MTDITLGQPLGGFYWRGTIPGQLCGATVTWACAYESSEPIAIPPFIDYAGQHVIVTNHLPEGTDGPGVPTYVSPGTLTLTPTVTCPNNAGDPIVTTLDPITLVISDDGCSSGCVNVIPDFPLNPGAEDGVMAPWTASSGNTVLASNAYTGTYAFFFGDEGPFPRSMSQSGMGFDLCDADGMVQMAFWVESRFVDGNVTASIDFLDSGGATIHTEESVGVPLTAGLWTNVTVNSSANAALMVQTKGFRVTIISPTSANPGMVVDDISLTIS